jgi:hypothetical protein
MIEDSAVPESPESPGIGEEKGWNLFRSFFETGPSMRNLDNSLFSG